MTNPSPPQTPPHPKCGIMGTIKSDEKCNECGEWFGDHKDDCKLNI